MIFDDLLKVRNADKLSRKGELLDSIALRGEKQKELLQIIFDKDVRFFIDTDKILQGGDGIGSLLIKGDDELEEELLSILKNLSKRDISGKEAINICIQYTDQLKSIENINMFIDILDNKTRLGIKATSIEKYCREFKIDQYEVMYALAYKKAKNIDWTQRWAAQPKIDGNRQIFEKAVNQPGVFFSRTGKITTSLEKLSNELTDIFGPGPYVIDGEVENGTLEETGFIRRRSEQANDAIYTIFGIYDYEQWETKKHTEKYSTTMNIMDSWTIRQRFVESKNIRMIESYEIKATSEDDFHKKIQHYMNRFIEQGYEGVVIKTLDHVYQPSAGTRRSKDWIKIKPEEDADGVIVSIDEGEGDDRGLAGVFKIRWMTNIFPVSSGKIKRDMRKYMFEHPELYIGKTLEFKYQQLSKYGVPRHAYAVKIRED